MVARTSVRGHANRFAIMEVGFELFLSDVCEAEPVGYNWTRTKHGILGSGGAALTYWRSENVGVPPVCSVDNERTDSSLKKG